ncbi:MAG: ShlB/FhaC/HecB family hemolysin secretion/activation protein [Candidatus Algichlamydia australiensis]|nr:ShlB/FhaC/HecB family hemolysin secretion/activation protein [Chlamydiales bacterium]
MRNLFIVINLFFISLFSHEIEKVEFSELQPVDSLKKTEKEYESITPPEERGLPSLEEKDQKGCCPVTTECNSGIIEKIIIESPYCKDGPILKDCNVEIRGLSLPCSIRKLAKCLRPFIGKGICPEQISCLKEAITTFYRENSHPFILITTPEQKVSEGVLRFEVHESCVDAVTVSCNTHFSTCVLEDLIDLKPGDRVDTGVIANDLYWINKNPMREASVLFKPGEQDMTTSVDYVVRDRRTFQIYAGADNTGIESTGKGRLYAGFNWANVWNLGHILTFQQTESTNFNRYWSSTGSYAIPFYGKNLLTFYGGYSKFKPTEEITNMRNRGHAWQVSGRYTFPLRALGQKYVHDLSFGADFKSTNTNLVFGDQLLIGSTTLISQLAFTYFGIYEHENVKVPLEAGVYYMPGSIFNDQSRADFESLRFKANNTYVYANASAKPYFLLPHDFGLSLHLKAQFSSANLLASEQFGLGGYDTVRGYDYRDVNKDNGLLGSIEFITPAIRKYFRLLAFFDYGAGWDHIKTPGIKNFDWLGGVGPGLRLVVDPHLYVRVDYGIKLNKTQFEPNASFGRWHLGVIANY